MNRDFICRCAWWFASALVLLATLNRNVLLAADRFAELDPYIQAAMQKWSVPGLAIAVVKDGEIVLTRDYGVCEVGTEQRVNSNTAFPIASCSKTFTATAVGLLVDDGRLRWDDPLSKHMPQFELSDRYVTQHCTVRDCYVTGLDCDERT